MPATYADLIAAIKDRNEEAARRILDLDATACQARDENGISAMLWAVYTGQSPLAEYMQQLRDEIDVFEAAALGDLTRIDELLTADPGIVNAVSVDGFTPLHLAAFFGHPEVVDFLLARGADVNRVATNASFVQPLHSGVAGRNLEVVRLLVENGAHVNATQQGGYTPIMAAIQNGDQEIEALLRRHGAVGDSANPPPA
ncbi:MAG TPA: ankyrin repeat domain-containing protein [bacterium]|nr:ankyrin repeat domain-containing protein [bacterium]